MLFHNELHHFLFLVNWNLSLYCRFLRGQYRSEFSTRRPRSSSELQMCSIVHFFSGKLKMFNCTIPSNSMTSEPDQDKVRPGPNATWCFRLKTHIKNTHYSNWLCLEEGKSNVDIYIWYTYSEIVWGEAGCYETHNRNSHSRTLVVKYRELWINISV